MAATPAEMLDALRRLELVEASRLGEIEDLTAAVDGTRLADALVKRKLLTAFQADYLLEGKGRDLAIGSYTLLDRLGRGGMGEVFKARQQRLGRVVALKLIRPEHLHHPGVVERFEREAKAAARLKHPNVVTIYDADHEYNSFFIAMEYVEGATLSKLVKQRGRLPIWEACDYARQAALGLQHAHEHGLVHRDIKPSNLIVTRIGAAGDGPGLLKILDFGLSRVTSELADQESLTPTDQWLGTPDFTAPEQARNSKAVDIRADIFSLGCTLYYLLTGHAAFGGTTRMEKLLARLEKDRTPVRDYLPQAPRELEEVLARMLARAPEERYQTPAELAGALEPFCRADADVAESEARTDDSESATDTKHKAPEKTVAPAGAKSDSDRTPLLTPHTPADWPRSPRRTPGRRVALAAGVVLVASLSAALFLWPKGDPLAAAKPPESFVNSIGMKLVRIPAGSFMMGAPIDEGDHAGDEIPQHRVEIKQTFWMGAYEVTQNEYQAIMGANPSHFSPLGAGAPKLDGVEDTGIYPVDSVTWDEAMEFCRKLTAREREENRTYRLPSEAEWEYACRAGTTTPFAFGNKMSLNEGNFDSRFPYGDAPPRAPSEATVPVGRYQPNAFGLYDMHGNVFEWCRDFYAAYDEKVRLVQENRVMRGGAWLSRAADCRSARRDQAAPDCRAEYIGFRVVCEP